MCGRYTLRRPGLLRKLVYQSEFEEFNETRLEPGFGLRPSTAIPIIRFDQAKRRVLGTASWGLIPFWSKERPTAPPINAQSETAAVKPTFREPFRRRRCLIPADGFYEPKGPKSLRVRQPYFFRRPDDELFAFAGLWDRWKSPEGETVETCVMLTIGPNMLMRPIHDRMPVILQPGDYDRWLDRDVQDVADLLQPAPDDFLETWQVLNMDADPEQNRGVRPGVRDP